MGGGMTQKHLMVAINWYGPYHSIDEARESAWQDYSDGLYFAMGKCKHERRKTLQYIGIGRKISTRLNASHHKLRLIVREMEIWLGEISTAEPSGKRLKATKTTLDFAEWLHAHFLKLPLNDRKKLCPPSRSVTVLNRWYRTDYATPRRRPHADWPDLIDYPDEDGVPSRAVWFGKKQRLFRGTE